MFFKLSFVIFNKSRTSNLIEIGFVTEIKYTINLKKNKPKTFLKTAINNSYSNITKFKISEF